MQINLLIVTDKSIPQERGGVNITALIERFQIEQVELTVKGLKRSIDFNRHIVGFTWNGEGVPSLEEDTIGSPKRNAKKKSN